MALLHYGRLAELAYGVVLLRRRPSGREGSNPSSSAKLQHYAVFCGKISPNPWEKANEQRTIFP